MRTPSIYVRGGRQRLVKVREQLRRKNGLGEGIDFDMGDFVMFAYKYVEVDGYDDYTPVADEKFLEAYNNGREIPASCGTTACIGGAVVLNHRGGKIRQSIDYFREAIKLVLNRKHPNHNAAEDVLSDLMTSWNTDQGPWAGLRPANEKNAAKAITVALRMIDRLQKVAV